MSAIIGISGTLRSMEFPQNIFEPRATVNDTYVKAIAKAGGAPLILPVTTTTYAEEIVSRIDGLVLTGGDDISPFLYGEEPLAQLSSTLPERDLYEMALLKATLAQNKPVLAICRGVQLMNVAFGGTLYQDISYAPNIERQHLQRTDPVFPIHSITTQPESELHAIFGEKAMVNSLHHQVIRDVADGFQATAWASDGVIEGMEREGDLFVVGVQWHPEIMVKQDDEMCPLFETFVQKVAKNNK
ncbi:gamma-glutamyl-gamma-aminobutyrate hydrolase family protein [Listeria booriae]|uniref:gamma-glutamyl-gamma-aminobutyrate hydrolase family protein n=1 Tax=Listeria booriae TaxID=1552123 RepID=UPI0016284850|nr:gamma-glutamyl-gamma-aminobutyrate hydrolase family protein [Listeria booriae]MBC1525566.1 gamma-glutamyl-gamma-aminobutyrate hydrolase family protein [Listeria booriae]